jgi:hypothetical protein
MKDLDLNFIRLSGTSREKVEEFMRDMNVLLELGLYWSDACEIVFALKDYGFNMQSDTWNEFLDICCGHPMISTAPTITNEPIFQ